LPLMLKEHMAEAILDLCQALLRRSGHPAAGGSAR
jgi:hypothetical protein